MRINPEVECVIDRALAGEEITPPEARTLMSVDVNSDEMYALMATADELTKRQFGNRGEVFAQIGINFWPCPKSCGFCVFGENWGLTKERVELDSEEVVARAKVFEEAGANAIFLMITADYPFDRYFEIAESVRDAISPDLPLVANIGDFGPHEADRLLETGFQGVYHVFRLREERDTEIAIEARVATLEAVSESNLDLSYCVEPIGPEHPPEELVEEMFRGKEYGAVNHACMRRTPIEGTPLAAVGEISEWEMARAVAATRLVAGDTIRAMGVHEPSLLSLRAGANQIYAETGPNPRDTVDDTETGRGRSVQQCRRMLWEAGYTALEGPTSVFRGGW